MEQINTVDFLVVSNIDVATKEEVISELITNLDVKNYLSSKEVFLKDVIDRENEIPTYIGHEIGLPHSQSDGVKSSTVTVGRLVNPIKWTDDGELVTTVFLISVPKQNEDNLHLKILSKLARLLMHEDFRAEVENADENVLIELLNQKVKEEIK
ncbi:MULTISPECIES: PTS sugar transporter subunit IIA [Paraliobacillus]|uniref:PTS sugar transporter subunit IIA n=1 Tax=Paraliobacillus TaxID=200903 RepID=UPI000DD2EF5A|nr:MULTISPECIES: fructose PTS transporter subunit IIA [Paraliobacillus]